MTRRGWTWLCGLALLAMVGAIAAAFLGAGSVGAIRAFAVAVMVASAAAYFAGRRGDR
jgi:hypothetical protein